MNRILLALGILPLLAGAASAAPLCRDLKGLYTPCAGDQAPHAARRRHPAPLGTANSEPGATVQQPRPPARARKPAPVTTARLCRDLKGLFTPCPR